MKWKNEKNELERLINKEHISYEEIGRRYNVSGQAVKKAAKRLGIVLPKRREINPNEHFNRGTGKKGICVNCGKEFFLHKSVNKKFCCHQCQLEYQRKEYIERWKNGEESGLAGGYCLSKHIRRYFFEKYGHKCEKCGWGEVNKHTNRVPLQIHHIDGDCTNNKEENLQLLCPNCHSLTENFGSRNRNATNGRTEYFKKN